MLQTLYDDNLVRYRLVKSLPTEKLYNWIFLPGGPGADSSYYLTLIEELNFPGNYWLMDFPANGDNFPEAISAAYDFAQWKDFFLPAIQRFDNPILVGQSFGGMFPLLFPALEKLLKGLVLINAAPTAWLEEAARYAKENKMAADPEAREKFKAHPSPETFKTALLANAAFHFPESSREKGKEMFAKLAFNYHATLWWVKLNQDLPFNAEWVPQQVPTLILGGGRDFIVPASLFERDPRFQRDNIKILTFEQAGHFLWLDEMAAVKEAFEAFFKSLPGS